jgi:hypothetical protein
MSGTVRQYRQVLLYGGFHEYVPYKSVGHPTGKLKCSIYRVSFGVKL